MPYVNEETTLPKSKNQARMSIEESVAAAVVPSVTALGASSQVTSSNIVNTSSKLSFL